MKIAVLICAIVWGLLLVIGRIYGWQIEAVALGCVVVGDIAMAISIIFALREKS